VLPILYPLLKSSIDVGAFVAVRLFFIPVLYPMLSVAFFDNIHASSPFI